MKQVFPNFGKSAIVFLGFVLITAALRAQAAQILETAPSGVTNGGTSVLTTQYLGARFHLDTSYLITGIGGHIKAYSSSDRSLFAAIVPLSEPNLLPSDHLLTNAIYAQVFLAPYNDVGPYPYQVPDTILTTDFLLGPGEYGLVFGSGLFGATGSGWMPVSGPIQPLPYFFAMNRFIGDYFRNLDEQPVRFIVQGEPVALPEPTTAALMSLALLGFAATQRKRRS